MSIDIDLFTDIGYGGVDFRSLQAHLRNMFPYCIGDCGSPVGVGATYIVGNNRDDAVKLDLFYTDPFIESMDVEEGIRMASMEDVIAMKLDVVARGGRKKDFWDIHELAGLYYPSEMLYHYEKRYPFGFSRENVICGFNNYTIADREPDPHCLKNKDWETVKEDLRKIFLT